MSGGISFLTVGLGLGTSAASGGLHSAVFQLFIVLAVFAILTIVITRFSETWNWPLQAFPLRVLIPVLVVLIVGWTNSSKSRSSGSPLWEEPLRASRSRSQPVLDGAVNAVPDDDIAVLEAWKTAAQKSMPADGQGNKPNPKLAILAVSGGANRAGFWTAAVLEKLDSLPHFRSHLRLITGASGGMVGAAYYVAELNNPGRNRGAAADRPDPDQEKKNSLSAGRPPGADARRHPPDLLAAATSGTPGTGA